jgi:hypothetical protein
MPNAPVTVYSGLRLDPYMDPDDALEYAVNLQPSLTYPRGTVLAEVAATPGLFGPYATGGSGGLNIPKAILEYPAVTDASGNITIAGEQGMTRKDVPAYFAGTFACADLVGLDAGGVTAAGWRLINGSVTTGVVRLG